MGTSARRCHWTGPSPGDWGGTAMAALSCWGLRAAWPSYTPGMCATLSLLAGSYAPVETIILFQWHSSAHHRQAECTIQMRHLGDSSLL